MEAVNDELPVPTWPVLILPMDTEGLDKLEGKSRFVELTLRRGNLLMQWGKMEGREGGKAVWLVTQVS